MRKGYEIMFILIICVILIAMIIYAICTTRSDLCGRCVEAPAPRQKSISVETPEDCQHIIMLGLYSHGQYISYIDMEGNHRLKRFSNKGKLLVRWDDYILRPPVTEKKDE